MLIAVQVISVFSRDSGIRCLYEVILNAHVHQFSLARNVMSDLICSSHEQVAKSPATLLVCSGSPDPSIGYLIRITIS